MSLLQKYFRSAVAATGISLLSSCAVTNGFMPFDGDVDRDLTDEEIALAQEIFGDHIDYSEIKVTQTRAKYNRAFHNRLRITADSYSDNYGLDESLTKRKVFIHELTHIWQEQEGKSVVARAIGLLITNWFNYANAYKFEHNDVPNFSNLNIEQQADIVERYYAMRETNKALNGADPYNCPAVDFYESPLTDIFHSLKPEPLCQSYKQKLSGGAEQSFYDFIR